MRPHVLLLPALVAPALGGCALFGGSDHLDDALDATPADATGITFVDRARIAERLGLEDASADDYADELIQTGYAGTPIAPYLVAMADAAVSELDIDWSLRATLGAADEGIGSEVLTIYRVSDDVDLDDVVDEMVDAGFEKSEIAGRPHLVAEPSSLGDDGLFGGLYPVEWNDVVIDADEHLIVSGTAHEEVLATVDDDADSATDADSFAAVLDGADEAEYAAVVTQDDCGAAVDAPGDLEAVGAAYLGTASTVAYVVTGDDAEPGARLQFPDDAAAEADADARQTYLDDGALLRTRQPLSEFGDFEVEVDGDVVDIDMTVDASDGAEMMRNLDGFAACA